MQEQMLRDCQYSKRDFASPSAKNHYRPNIQLEPFHQKINLTFDIKESACNGSVIQRIRANVANNSSLELNGINFSISDIKSSNNDSKKVFPIKWEYNGNLITVSWEDSWNLNEIRDLEIFYEVKKPIAGLYYSYPDEHQPNKPIYVGADHETERARYWLPCVDHPSIRTTLEFYLTSEASYTILANGKLVDEKINDNLKTSHWVLDFPCPSYLLTVCIGDLVSYTDREADAGNGPIPVKYFTTKKYSSEDLKISFDRTPKMLEWMNKKLGVPLPYPKYFQYALPQYGGAMENISLVSWDDFAVLDETMAKEHTWLIDQINVHEMAHSWFGDSVVMKDFAHAWMKESWATYMETVWLDEMVSKIEGDYDRFVNQRRYKNETKNYVRPIVTNKYDSSWNLFDSHLYPGGAQRIDMLRKSLGDTIFWSAVTDYLKTYQGKVAETSDFQKIMEKHSGLNLQQFFDQWYYSKGFPILKITYKYDDKNKLVELKIKQTQVDKEKNVGLFEFDLEIRIETEEGKFSDFIFKIKEEQHVFYVKSDSSPKQIIIDEQNKVLMDFEFNPGTEMLKRIYQLGSIKNKILSANELAKEGSTTIVEFLIAEYKKESFWGLKQELITVLGSIYNKDAIEGLISLLDSELDPMVRKDLINTINKTPLDKKIFEKAKDLLINKESLYFAQRNLLLLIGSYGEKKEETFTFLSNFTPKKDPKEYVIGGKRQAIGKLRTVKATNYLLQEFMNKEIPNSEMPSLISALTDSVMWAEDKEKDLVKEALINRLKTENVSQILRSLGTALTKFNDPSLNSHINKIKSKIAFQDHPAINKIIEGNKGKGPNEEFKKLEERLSKLEKENLELKDKLLKMEQMIDKSGN